MAASIETLGYHIYFGVTPNGGSISLEGIEDFAGKIGFEKTRTVDSSSLGTLADCFSGCVAVYCAVLPQIGLHGRLARVSDLVRVLGERGLNPGPVVSAEEIYKRLEQVDT